MRWRYATGLGVLIGVGAALVIVAALTRGPSYGGRGLAHWLQDLRNPSSLVQHRAQEAIRQIGSNAVPMLRNRLHAEDGPLTTNIVGLLQRQTLVPIPFVPARERRIRAALACAVLGPVAEPAIPDLLAFGQGDAFCANLAQSALGCMDEGAVGPLAIALTNADYRVRGVAVTALAHIGPQAWAAIPALTNHLKNGYITERADAARALYRIGVASPGVVRALAEAVEDPLTEVRTLALLALTGFGEPVVPMLSALLKDADSTVRAGAEKALDAINAKAKAEAGRLPGG